MLEFGAVASGPYAGMLLADMGADVVKLEPPFGDDLRRWPPIVELAGGEPHSLNFASLNRNKRSVSLDLKTESGLAKARSLAQAADIVIENYRPGVLARLGLAFDDVKAINHDVIFCSISGYGQQGPRGQDGAYDVVIQAESGLMDVTGSVSGAPAKCGVPVADFITGQYAAFSVVCAYSARHERRAPVYIDLSMLEGVLAVSALQTSEYWGTGASPRRLGSAHPRNAPYQAFRAADREFIVAAGNDRLWRAVCRTIDDPELAEHPQFNTQAKRVLNVKELERILNARFTARPAEDWIELLRTEGVPCGLVNTYAEALESKQLRYRDFVQDLPLSDGSTTRTTAMPMRIDGINAYSLKPPPRLGEHTDRVLNDWTSE